MELCRRYIVAVSTIKLWGARRAPTCAPQPLPAAKLLCVTCEITPKKVRNAENDACGPGFELLLILHNSQATQATQASKQASKEANTGDHRLSDSSGLHGSTMLIHVAHESTTCNMWPRCSLDNVPPCAFLCAWHKCAGDCRIHRMLVTNYESKLKHIESYARTLTKLRHWPIFFCEVSWLQTLQTPEA